jgi:hypothetical protein
MKCICGYEIGEPPFENWEECPNCDMKLNSIDWMKKMLAVVEAARELYKLWLNHGIGEVDLELEENLINSIRTLDNE